MNYPKFGLKYCRDNLNIPNDKIIKIVSKFKIKKDKIEKIRIDVNNKYFCYVLGLIWSDGHVEKKRNRVLISLLENDIIDILDIFIKVGKWNITYSNNEKRNYRNQIRLDISDSIFKNFLLENDFIEKSFKSPDKIISIIPENNLKYFIRGISDGDGCFYYNKKQYTRQFTIASTYDQDWSYIINILNNIGCGFKIEKTNKENSKSSIIRITNKDILKLGHFIYDDFFGLSRKYEKFKLIEDSYDIKNHKIKYGNRKPISINGEKYSSIKEASESLKIYVGTLRKRIKNGFYDVS